MAAKSNSAKSPCFLVRYWNVGAFSPCAKSGSAAPSACSMSSVGGWNVDARDSSLSVAPCSNTVTGTPARARCAAATRPTGPAPAIRTRSSPNGKLLDLLDAGLGDDVAILDDLSVVPLLHLIEWHPHRLGAGGLEALLDLRVFDRGLHFLVELFQDWLWRAGRREQSEPAAFLVLRHAELGGGRRVRQRGDALVAGNRQRVRALGAERAGDVGVPLEAERHLAGDQIGAVLGDVAV